MLCRLLEQLDMILSLALRMTTLTDLKFSIKGLWVLPSLSHTSKRAFGILWEFLLMGHCVLLERSCTDLLNVSSSIAVYLMISVVG